MEATIEPPVIESMHRMGSRPEGLLPRRNNVKKNEVYALISNPHGGVTRGVERLVLSAHKDKAYDTTRYGEFSTHSFYSHHATQISLAIVTSDAEAIKTPKQWRLESEKSRFHVFRSPLPPRASPAGPTPPAMAAGVVPTSHKLGRSRFDVLAPCWPPSRPQMGLSDTRESIPVRKLKEAE